MTAKVGETECSGLKGEIAECGCRHKLFLSYIRTQSKLSDQDVIYGYVSSFANDSELPNNALGQSISSFRSEFRLRLSIL